MLNSYTLNSKTLNSAGLVLTPNEADFAVGNIVVSDYKWLTQALKTIQQQYNVRPYLSCKIVDDSLVQNQTLANISLVNGSSVTAPDGKVLAVGKNVAGTLGFWKITDPSVASQWNTYTVLDATTGGPSTNGYRGDLNASISVSEYIKGTYTIDVYYFATTGTTSMKIMHSVSEDGGTTWTNESLGTVYASSDTPYISAGKPVLNLDNTIRRIYFVNGSSTFIGDRIEYSYKDSPQPYTVGGWSSLIPWSPKNVNTGEWVINSLDSFYDGDNYSVVFSGYHTVFEMTGTNSSLYLSTLEDLTGVQATDLWGYPKNIILSLASTEFNKNSFTLPRCNFDGESLWLTFKSDTVTSITSPSTDGTVTSTTVEFYFCRSKNLIDFTYPVPVSSSDGTIFSDTAGNNFVNCGSYYYVLGNAQLWQFIQNNVVADVSNDLLGYDINEQAQQVNSITLSIGNQNNQWYGSSSPTASSLAIKKDRKIYIDQGFYDIATGIPYSVPRNIFYIDDIHQNVSSTTNDLTIQARDLKRNQKILTSNFQYNYNGIANEVDTMNGTNVSNWNQQSGTWVLNNGAWRSYVSTGVSYDPSIDYALTYSIADLHRPSYCFMVNNFVLNPSNLTNASTTFYAFYQDNQNWIRLRINPSGVAANWAYAIEKSIAGTVTTVDSGLFAALADVQAYTSMMILKSDYYKFTFIKGLSDSSFPSRMNFQPSNSTIIGSQFYDFTTDFQAGSFSNGAVGAGGQNHSIVVSDFIFTQYSNSLSVGELIKSIGTKASVFEYVQQTNFADYLYDPSNFAGTFSMLNRTMNIVPGNLVIKNKDAQTQITDLQIENGEVNFRAKVNPTSPSGEYDFSFVFRNQSTANTQNGYEWNIGKKNGSGGNTEIVSRFVINSVGSRYILASSSSLDYSSTSTSSTDLNIDLTQYNDYKLVFTDGWFLGFINGFLVQAWNDGHDNGIDSFTDGYIGFYPNNAATIDIENIVSPVFYHQLDAYAVNPGDDFESPCETVAETVGGFNFSDLMGRLKTIVLRSSDLPNYSYQNQILKQKTDNSAKEYANQVVVYGDGVLATVRDDSPVSANSIVRTYIITDYKITTYKDALTRAQSEINNIGKYSNQSSITQIMNIGSEIFDVVTVINTGPNSSDVNSNLRIYNQEFKSTGDTQHSLMFETGNP